MPKLPHIGRFGASRGFYLLEVLIAMFLFVILAYPLFSLFANYYRASGKARGILVASHLAEKKMEEQLSLGWQATTIAATPSTVTYIQDNQEISVVYNVRVNVRDLSDPADPTLTGLKEVLVRVEWKEDTGDKSIELQSLLYWGG